MDDSVVIALFRHGLTEANKRKAYLGWTDSPICIGEIKVPVKSVYDGYFSSDLKRCIETAKIFFPNTNPKLLKELREINFGAWDGKTYDELKEDSRYQKWLSDPFQYYPPDGESFQQFQKRIQAGWRQMVDEILLKDLQSCVVITHGGVIRQLLTKYAPEKKEFWEWQSPHHRGFELTTNREALRRGERCTLLQEVPLMEKGNG
ncbi:histidine phosphatase family protein [Bacillus salipaludis]|uniref:Histidine phosphatase family protein n=1 Tax=Bacillus salipaludis TaxID=2547811 RepID=A0A4R5VXM4_9BACI|nr:histidine phosphatase family protein [Bacillus salipaludis]MDQ6597400.1 histidine phosphatase family protein [Bacillus salipaludis]TDK63171.1 histidine phosphatase family protein [Bacillus salipaludis]